MTERENVFKHDNDHDVAVVIPTCGGIHLLNCIARVSANSGNSAHIVVSLNPMDAALASHTKQVCEQITENVDLDITWVEADRPLGFGGAVNAGIDFLKENGMPELVVVLNDDTAPSPGWIDGMREAFSPPQFSLNYIKGGNDGKGLDFSKHPPVGIVGPASNNVIRDQVIDVQGLTPDLVDQFAKEFSEANSENFISTNFLSGFCMAISRDLIEDLINEDGFVFDPIFNERIGGFEDNDLCLRAQHIGYGLMIAGQTYVHHEGHQTIGSLGILNGMANYPVYLNKWKDYTQRDQKLASVYRVKLETLNDLFIFKESLRKMASVGDSISVLLTANPSDMADSDDFSQLQMHLEVTDKEMLNACTVCEEDGVAPIAKKWIEQVVKGSWHAGNGDVSCAIWDGFFNERDERNCALKLAHEFDPDWIISVDHDEVLENRVDRAFMEKLMKNPSPEVFSYDFSWLNHWNSPDYIRIDSPWGDNGAYDGSMRGTRMYRNFSKDSLIFAGNEIGLHCGNVPSFAMTNVRSANARFHHFGYMRGTDRVRKYKNYTALDANPSAASIGKRHEGDLPYQHLVDEVNMVLSPTPRACGIAFTGLAYEGEDPCHFIRMLEHVYGTVDQICMVWTDPTIKSPSEEWVQIGKLYNVDWVTHTFDGDLSACRNAGLDRLRETRDDGVGWVLSMDLDEFFTDYIREGSMIRRMAEHPKPVSWLFTFINSLGEFNGEQRANESSTHRMFRIDPTLDIKWEGKVHEGISRSIFRLREGGFPAHFAKAPFKLFHLGLNKSNEEIHQKLEKYGKMLYDECEENPNEAMPWNSLGLHFLNDGRTDEAVTCFNFAIAINGPESWMGHKELGSHYLRLAKASYALAGASLDDGHDMYGHLMKMNEGLREVSVDYPYIGRAKEGRFFQSEITSLPSAIPDNVKRMLEEHGGVEQVEGEPKEQEDSLIKSTQEVSLSNGSKL